MTTPEQTQTTSLSKILGQVQKLVSFAEAPIAEGATQEQRQATLREQASARAKADALMLKYAIDEATARASRPASVRSTPVVIDVSVGEISDIIGYVAGMLNRVARHTRCKVRNYAHFDSETKQYFSKAYGFESDVRYLEVLYTTLRLHMLGALSPKVNPAESVEVNSYRLHNAGFNWLDIAGMYGWRKQTWAERIRREHERGLIPDELYEKWLAGKSEVWYHEGDDKYLSNWQVGGIFKRATQREGKKHGEDNHRKISAGGAKTYRLSAAQGYLDRISARLREVERTRQTGGGLVLASAADDLEDFYREANASAYTRCPKCEKLSADPYDCDRCGHHIEDEPPAKASGRRSRAWKAAPFNGEAYGIGVAHANTADITGRNMPGGDATALS